MRRLRLGSCSLIASACIATAAGCVGETKPPSGDPPDARPGVDARLVDAMPDGPTTFQCRNKITSGLDSGHHNEGQNCQQSCHNHGFFMSGTLYSAATNGNTVAGASITFVDATGATGDMRTNVNGNFWWSLPVTFPVKIIASMCPDIQPMNAMVTAAGAGCNKDGCHTAVMGSAGRIHLP
jgi:hypothetical protein